MGASAEARGRRQARTLTLKGALTGGSHTVGCSSKISFTEMICPLLFFTFFSLRKKYQNLERARTGSVLHLQPRGGGEAPRQSHGGGGNRATRRPERRRAASGSGGSGGAARAGQPTAGHAQLHSIHRRLRGVLRRQVPPHNLVLVVLHGWRTHNSPFEGRCGRAPC